MQLGCSAVMHSYCICILPWIAYNGPQSWNPNAPVQIHQQIPKYITHCTLINESDGRMFYHTQTNQMCLRLKQGCPLHESDYTVQSFLLIPLVMIKHSIKRFICQSVPLHRCISKSPNIQPIDWSCLPLVVSAVTAAVPAERRSFFQQALSQSQSSPSVMVALKLSYHYAVPCVPTQSGSGTKMDLRIKP